MSADHSTGPRLDTPVRRHFAEVMRAGHVSRRATRFRLLASGLPYGALSCHRRLAQPLLPAPGGRHDGADSWITAVIGIPAALRCTMRNQCYCIPPGLKTG